MIRTLIALLARARQAWLLELAGAGLIVAGVAAEWGTNPALITGGAMLILKAAEVDS